MLRALSVGAVAIHFDVHRRTIERLKNIFNETGTVVDKARSSRPKATNAAEDRHIRTTHLGHRFKTASETV